MESSRDNQASTHAALGETAPALGTAASFVVLAGTTVTNTGPTTILGDLGVNPGLAITGFPPGLVSGGTLHAGDAVSLQGQNDVTTAYNVLAGEPCGRDLTDIDLGGLTLVPGVYCFSSAAQLTGALVLDSQGRADAVFVFKTVSTLTTATRASVSVINGGNDCGVFWQIGSSAVLGTGTAFSGSILALTSISLATGATVSGRVLARNGAVTMDSNAVSMARCTAVPVPTDAGVADAAPLDSGNETGTTDASMADAGSGQADGGAPPDAGPAPDAGASQDAGAAQDSAAADACCNDTMCGVACIDLRTDSMNCGACGNACAATETCTAGACTTTCK